MLSIGIPQARAKFYSDRVTQGDCLITIDGSTNDMAQAAKLLKHQGVQEWEIYEVVQIDSTCDPVQEQIATEPLA